MCGQRLGVRDATRCFILALLTWFLHAEDAPRDNVGELQPVEERNVLVLGESNFEVAISANRGVLVQFYAPWCGHCKQFAAEFEEAARILKQVNSGAVLAKVDATTEVHLTETYGVRGYPTLKLFLNGTNQEYTGRRAAENVVAWVRKKIGPVVIEIADVAAAETFVQDLAVSVLGLFESESPIDAFEEVSRSVEDLMFGYSSSTAVLSFYGVSSSTVRMSFPHDEKVAFFSDDLADATAIEAFIKAYRRPRIVEFSGRDAPELFDDGRPMFILFREKDEKGLAAERWLEQSAAIVGRNIQFVLAGTDEPIDQRLMDYLNVDPLEDLPTARLIENPSSNLVKYKYDGEFSEASALGVFLQKYEAGQLRPYLKSEAVPIHQTSPVVTLVGSTFDAIVKESGKDVLVEFYAPWCGHCKKFETAYRQLAERLKHIESLVVAKIDADANDVEGVDIEGFPMIKLWRAAHSKDEPLDYDGDRGVDSLAAWLETKVSISKREMPPDETEAEHTEL